MNELSVFNFEQKDVECIIINDEILFNPYDVGRCLDLERTTVRDHLSKMDPEERILLKNSDVDSTEIRKFNNAGETFLTESGLYMLIFVSRKPEAKKFKKWLAREVLPSIRKSGTYGSQLSENSRLIQNLMNTTEQLLGIKVEELAILQQESPNKRLSNLMIDCARNGLGSMKQLYSELFYVFAAESGIDIPSIADLKNMPRMDYLKDNPTLCNTLYNFAFEHFTRSERQVTLLSWNDYDQKSLTDFK